MLTHEPAAPRVALAPARLAPEPATDGERGTATATTATLPELDRFPASSVGAVQWRIARLAEIWPPHDLTGGVIVNLTPLPPDEIAAVERQGYSVVAPARDRWPYTHVITAWPRDYLAALVPTTAAPADSHAWTGEGAVGVAAGRRSSMFSRVASAS